MQTLTTLNMKTSSLIFISCFLFTLSENFLPGTAQTTVPGPVLGTAGQPLHRGANYYILPAEHGNGDSLTLASGKNGSCSYEIVQSLNEGANCLQLTFSPVDNDTTIRANTDHNIRFINFSSPQLCPQSNVWTMNRGLRLLLLLVELKGTLDVTPYQTGSKFRNMKMPIKLNIVPVSPVNPAEFCVEILDSICKWEETFGNKSTTIQDCLQEGLMIRVLCF